MRKNRKVSGADRRADNHLKFGLQTNRHLLPWEREEEFKSLVRSLRNDFNPKGVVEGHLVDELANIMWRKHRIAQAEAAAFYEGMLKPSSSLIKAAQLAVPGQSI